MTSPSDSETTGYVQVEGEPRPARATDEWSDVWAKSDTPAAPDVGKLHQRLALLANDIEQHDLFGGTRSAEAATDIRFALASPAAETARLREERDEARRRQHEIFERGVRIDGKPQSPVWLERSAGANFLWLVWAVKPGEVRLIAICSDETKADHYAANLPPGLEGWKPWKERAPIDHAFGFADSMHARVQGKL